MSGKSLAAAAVCCGAAAVIRSEYEKKHFIKVCYDIESGKIDGAFDRFRLVYLSDLHNNSFGPRNEQLKEAILSGIPDAVVIGGDMMITKKRKPLDFSVCADLIAWLGARFPVYYANGNHETRMEEQAGSFPGWAEAYARILRKSSVIRLRDTEAVITRGAGKLRLFGINPGEELYRKFSAGKMPEGWMEDHLGTAPEDGFRLLLAHTPAYAKEYAAWGADLTLSGHFHGGTIRIPGAGGLMTPQFTFFSPFTKDFIFTDGMPMIISSGLGTHSVNIRLNNPPQLIFITFHAGKPGGKSGTGIRQEKKICFR